jgi:hypothetical protein
MVRWMRTARVSSGANYVAAVAWAKDIARLVEKKGYVREIVVSLDLFGPTGTIRWTVDHDDLASLEKVQAQLTNDPEYFEKMREADGLFLPDSFEDVVMRSL